MAFEEYWMESIERVVGHALLWWDYRQSKSCMLKDFAFINKTLGEIKNDILGTRT
jgi:hypothetical protein